MKERSNRGIGKSEAARGAEISWLLVAIIGPSSRNTGSYMSHNATWWHLLLDPAGLVNTHIFLTPRPQFVILAWLLYFWKLIQKTLHNSLHTKYYSSWRINWLWCNQIIFEFPFKSNFSSRALNHRGCLNRLGCDSPTPPSSPSRSPCRPASRITDRSQQFKGSETEENESWWKEVETGKRGESRRTLRE